MSRTGTLPRIKIDLTQHEVVIEKPELRLIRHFYSDAPTPALSILCYSINEILAEKTRALYERKGRARDAYDVVNIWRNHSEEIDPPKARLVLRKKFEYKSLQLPALAGYLGSIDFDALEADWDQQLRHQLPALPPAESYCYELRRSALSWMESQPIIESLPRVPVGAGETTVPRMPFPQMERSRFARAASAGRGALGFFGALDTIRFAARNRLCAEIVYHGVARLTEPYSLRLRGTGNLLLYVYEISRGGTATGTTKAYNTAEIQSARISERVFRPQYAVEL
jgi:hypothetical protein